MGNDEPNANQAEGRTDQAAGEVKELVGDATGDKDLQREGANEKAAGAAQEAVGDVQQAAADGAAAVAEQAGTSVSEAVRERYDGDDKS